MTEEEMELELARIKAETEQDEQLAIEQAMAEMEQETTTTTTLTTVGLKTKWTAEDFERYGAKLAAEAEKKKAAAKARLPEEKETKGNWFNLESLMNARQQIKEKRKALVEKEGTRIRSKYGEQLTDDEVLKVLEVEDEMYWCKSCNGKYCNKTHDAEIYKIVIYDTEAKELKIKNCACPRLMQTRYGLSKIPPLYIGKMFEDYKVDNNNATAIKAAQKLIDSPDKGAYFYGGVGTGKTLLAAIIAQELIRRGCEVIFATVQTISARIRSTFNKSENKSGSKIGEEEILEKLYTVPTLILDDIGMEKPTRFICSTLCNVFNERYNARLQTIMTSNYTLKQLEYIFNNPTDSRESTLDGTRMYDRCKQMCVPIELKGESRR